MILEKEYVSPYEMSLTARVGMDEAEEENLLSSVLPAEIVFGQSIDFIKNGSGFNEVAQFRAYDAETAFGDSGEDVEEVTVKLPALGQKVRISELDQLKAMGTGNQTILQDMRLRAAKRRGRAVADAIELMRGQVLETGSAVINENRFKKSISFDRDPLMAPTAGTSWLTGLALTDLDKWMGNYVTFNGQKPARMIVSTAGLSAFKKNAEVVAAIFGDNSPGKRVTDADLNDFLLSEKFPAVEVYDKKVRKGGQAVRIFDEDVALFVPSQASEAGVTAWGTTLESLDAEYEIAEGDRSGIVVAAMKSRDPIGVYAHAAAIGLPVLKNANAFMAATIL